MIGPQRLLAGIGLLVVLLLAGWFGLEHYGASRYDAGHAAAVAERKAADDKAVLARTRDNAVVTAQQAAANLTITEKKHEELAPVRERVVTQRVYVGSAICGDRAAAPAQAESTAGGDGANPPGRLVRPDVERDIVALKLAVEEDLATGRTCQRFLEANGLTP